MTEEEYHEILDRCVSAYSKVYKDALVMDICEVDRTTRLRLLKDPEYLRRTKALKAELFAENVLTLNKVMTESAENENAQLVLKALEMKNKLLLEDLAINKDESNALNVTFVALTREDFEALDTVEVHEGSTGGNLGTFGQTTEGSSIEERIKANLQEKMEEK